MTHPATHFLQRHLFNMIAATAIALLLLQEATRVITEERDIVIRARFAADSERTLVEPSEVFPISCRLAGTAGKLARFQRSLPEVVELRVGADDVPGAAGTWDVADRMREFLAARLQPDGVDFRSASMPASCATLTITDLVDFAIPITLQPGDGIRGASVEGKPSMDIFLPRDLAGSGAELVVRLSALDRAPGSYEEEVVPKVEGVPAARLGEVRGIRPVRITYSVVAATRELTLPRVPVQVAALPETLAQYSVTLPSESQFLSDVVVAGPADAVTALDGAAARPIAIIHLTHEEFVNRVTTATVDLWMLPEGVRVLSVAGRAGTNPSIDIEITPHAIAPAIVPGAAPASTPRAD